jgi:hypothetical protein
MIEGDTLPFCPREDLRAADRRSTAGAISDVRSSMELTENPPFARKRYG